MDECARLQITSLGVKPYFLEMTCTSYRYSEVRLLNHRNEAYEHL